MSKTVSVLLAVRPGIVRRGLRTFLETRPDIKVIGETGDGDEALAQTISRLPKVVVLNCCLANLDWVDVTREISRQGLPTRSLAYCVGFCNLLRDSAVQMTAQCLVKTLTAGVTGYLEEENSSQIGEAVRSITRGENWFSPKTMSFMAELACGHKDEPGPARPTEREMQVLNLVSQGCSNAQIAKSLGISAHTVAFHLENLLSKLEANNRTAAVVKAIQRRWLAM